MEQERQVTIVHVQHAIFIEVPTELPPSCPSCHAWLEDEDENNLVELRLQMVKGATCIVLGTGKIKEPNGYDEAATDEDDVDGGPGKLVGYLCNRCKEPIIWTHIRSWILEGMDSRLASQLETLLYDSNVKDAFIKSRVFTCKTSSR
jgi:hypothetical protein